MQIVTLPPFNSDEFSALNDPTSPQLPKPSIPTTSSSTNLFSKNNSPTIMNDDPSFNQINNKPIKMTYLLTSHAIYLKVNT